MKRTFTIRFKPWFITTLGTVLAVVLTGWVVQAQGGFPEPTDLYINDYAGLLSADDAANIQSLFTDLNGEHGIEATVVTINSISDYDTGHDTIESFATALFNTWGIGNEVENNGILLLVAIRDRDVRIEVGSGYGQSQNAAMQEVINEHILPSFRNGKFSQGLYRGSRAIVGELTGDWPPDLTVSTTSSSEAGGAPVRSNPVKSTLDSAVNAGAELNPIALIGGGLATLGAAGLGLRRYFRYRQRRCPDCQTHMARLDEVSDDMFLDSGQKLEELLKSIDYDVWKCPSCNYHTLHGYSSWFSGYRRCPNCSYRTVKVTSETLRQPTYTSTGRKRVTKDCRNCSYRQQETIIIPKKTRSDNSGSGFSSSSGGSSFGGGSSSGGGASGKW